MVSRLTRLSWGAALHLENSVLRAGLEREFAAVSQAGTPAPKFERAMAEYRDRLLAGTEANMAAITALSGTPPPASSWTRRWLDAVFGGRGSYDQLGSVLRHLGKDWSAEGVQGMQEMHGKVLHAVGRELRDGDSCLVPGCGMGRLAWRIAHEHPEARVLGLEQSEAVLAIGTKMIFDPPELRSVAFHPFIDEPRNNMSDESRAAACVVPDVVVARPSNLHLRLAMFGGDEGAAPHRALVTHFFVDVTPDVRLSLQRIAAALQPGGCWVNAGVLAYHDWPMVSPTLDQLLLAAEEAGLELVDGPEVVRTQYLAKPGAMSHEHRWDAAFFVCRKRGDSTCPVTQS